ncbi:MAG: Coenzyme F420 hydrogenase/dehydrogenase, beta subunit C-terminal domain [Desulfobulbaceae bacterium]|nr:Coenzyme F420 hydrogenase/dehydrogenase, beta subunit C-terminal domain [Desulfobulbaceae bacterium]
MNTLIKNVVKHDLCLGCGTCMAICPKNAISMELDECQGVFLPKVDSNACNNCDLCWVICPGAVADYDTLNRILWGRVPDNHRIGHYLAGYKAYAINDELRHNCSSGGMVTALLSYLFENNHIDGALVTGMSPEIPWQSKSFIARSIDEVINAAGSKHCLFPTNIALREILDKEGRYAVVGLPCHIHAIRKAQLKSPKLKKRIKLSFGLLCASGRSVNGLKTLMRRLDISLDSVLSLKYRGNGWPGKLEVITSDGEKVLVDYKSYYPLMCLHDPHRCSLCHDKSSELADLSFGDLWLPEERKNAGSGKSICIVRNEKAALLFNAAARDGVISKSPLNEKDLLRAIQPDNKKRMLSARLAFCRATRYKGGGIPKIMATLDDYTFSDLLNALKYYGVQSLCKRRLALNLYLRCKLKYRRIPIERSFVSSAGEKI